MKNIVILGSTGSIGTQALDVIRKNRDMFNVRGLSCFGNVRRLEEQIEEFSPDAACAANEESARYLASKYPETEFFWGENGLCDLARSDCDIVIDALVGIAGLRPAYAAVAAGRDLALANKETLVAGGRVITEEAERKGVSIIPVDSEHSAIFQCLRGNREKDVKRILLTASGGPFRELPAERFADITPEEALSHPNWSMGRKITIDSASMMNKGFEVIEAKWLFGISTDNVQVLVHPQSIMHSAVEYMDGAVIAQLGMPDMRLPIQYALTYPERVDSGLPRLDFFKAAAELTFEEPDIKKFKCLKLAYDAIEHGGGAPACLNAANEVLVGLFLEGRIRFTEIPDTIEKVLGSYKGSGEPGLEEIFEIDRNARKAALLASGIGA